MRSNAESLLFGAIADDYTGGSDLASMLSGRGVRTLQILGLQPDEFVQAAQGYQAVVISLKSRSLPVAEACVHSGRALGQLRQLKARQIQFKYCSTFDSTAQGNIGPVIDTLMDALETPFTLAVPALPVNGRTQYLGHLFVGTQILAESHMRHHPITPMTDSNLVRHLQAQTRRKVGLVAHPVVRSGAENIRRECATLQSEGISVALVDAISDDDLDEIAEAGADLRLISGGSGLAMALPAAWTRRGWLSPNLLDKPSPINQGVETVLILSGSCSAVTLRQLQRFQESGGILIPLDVPRLLTHGPEAEITFLLSAVKQPASSQTPAIVFSSASPAEREKILQYASHNGWSAEKVHRLIEQVLAGLAVEVVKEGLSRRLIVAGGETSGAVVDALKIQAVEVMGAIDPGVPSLKSVGRKPLALALKSGNFGSPDFFLKAPGLLCEMSLREESRMAPDLPLQG
ncbi:MAG: four-carbon acid sugar kinase family protein [Acidobacteria bacterium]|nr:four-carbon acid sugar kinase family protein [Acidobacteriota bacterium]MCI0724879.1 four-carbon acid sugar kinase family protein [Acidobacteriota bacterium]